MQGIVILSYFLERKKVHNITVVETEGFWKAMVKLDLIETRFFFFFFLLALTCGTISYHTMVSKFTPCRPCSVLC